MTKRDVMQEKLNQLYLYLEDVIESRGCPPTVREIQAAIGVSSTGTVKYYLNKLQDMGLITNNTGKSRGIELSDSNFPKRKDFCKIPLIGEIAAGQPIFAEQSYQETYNLPINLFPAGGELFMLTVCGNSMIDVGIRNGDKIIVKRQSTAENGQIVAALVNGDTATVKRFYLEDGVIRLHPENEYMQDMFPEEVAILGIVIGLIRTEIR